MKYLSWIIIFLSPTLTQAMVVASCKSQFDHAYYYYLGIVPKEKQGWHVSADPGTYYKLIKLSNNTFDIQFIDATKELKSAKQEGAFIKLLKSNTKEITILVKYSEKGAGLEIYDFIIDNDGKYKSTILISTGGLALYKSSVESGECKFINFDLM